MLPRNLFSIINDAAHYKTKSFIKLKNIEEKETKELTYQCFIEAVVKNTLKLLSIRVLKLFTRLQNFNRLSGNMS